MSGGLVGGLRMVLEMKRCKNVEASFVILMYYYMYQLLKYLKESMETV